MSDVLWGPLTFAFDGVPENPLQVGSDLVLAAAILGFQCARRWSAQQLGLAG
jgi:hypothetical protein